MRNSHMSASNAYHVTRLGLLLPLDQTAPPRKPYVQPPRTPHPQCAEYDPSGFEQYTVCVLLCFALF